MGKDKHHGIFLTFGIFAVGGALQLIPGCPTIGKFIDLKKEMEIYQPSVVLPTSTPVPTTSKPPAPAVKASVVSTSETEPVPTSTPNPDVKLEEIKKNLAIIKKAVIERKIKQKLVPSPTPVPCDRRSTNKLECSQ